MARTEKYLSSSSACSITQLQKAHWRPGREYLLNESNINDDTVVMLVDDLNKLAINPECSLYQPVSTSSQEDSQSFSDDSNSQPMSADGSHPPDKLVDHDGGRKAALERFMVLCDIGSLGSIMKCPWEDTTAKTHNHYVNKVSEVIAGVIKTVAPDSTPELWQAVMTREVSQFLQIPVM